MRAHDRRVQPAAAGHPGQAGPDRAGKAEADLPGIAGPPCPGPAVHPCPQFQQEPLPAVRCAAGDRGRRRAPLHPAHYPAGPGGRQHCDRVPGGAGGAGDAGGQYLDESDYVLQHQGAVPPEIHPVPADDAGLWPGHRGRRHAGAAAGADRLV